LSAEDLYVPASILLRAPPAENAEVQEEELDLLTHCLAGRAEDHALLAGVAVAIEVGTEERGNDLLWRFAGRLLELASGEHSDHA